MNREEREEYVVRLYKEGRSIREIAQLVHMSFRDLGILIRKVKMEADGDGGQLEHDDVKTKSKTTQAFKLFSEFKRPVEVAIELDLPTDHVQAFFREYWELEGMYGLAQIYEEAKYDLHDLLRLHRIIKGLGTEKQDIINVFDFVKHNQLRTLQWKAVYLRYQINKLETEKTEATNHLFKLKRMIPELEEALAQKRKEMAHMDQDSKYDNTGNSHLVVYSEPDSS